MAQVDIHEVLSNRGEHYGSFPDHAKITCSLEDTFYHHYLNTHPPTISDGTGHTATIKEGLHMIFHKLGRLANGDIEHIDSWVDIAGYATLVAQHLERRYEEGVRQRSAGASS